jgi:hypothetical protein
MIDTFAFPEKLRLSSDRAGAKPNLVNRTNLGRHVSENLIRMTDSLYCGAAWGSMCHYMGPAAYRVSSTDCSQPDLPWLITPPNNQA